MVGLRRLIAGSAGTLLVGMFAGFVLGSAVGVFIQDSGLFGASGESPIARAYMLGLLRRDPNSVVGIGPNQTIAQRATEIQNADSSRTNASIEPLSLTYIRGASAGGDSGPISAASARHPEGVRPVFPLLLIVHRGQVKRR